MKSSIDHILNVIARSPVAPDFFGLQSGAAAWFTGQISTLGRPLLVVCPNEEDGRRLAADLKLFSDLPVLFYPDLEVPPYASLRPDPTVAAARLAALYQVLSADMPFIFVASASSLLTKTMPRQELDSLAELLISGEETNSRQLLARLAAGGYEPSALVQEVGEYSVRGGIIDIFAPGREVPLRLDFFGDTVESIRHFDPISQRSIEEVQEVIVLPVSDILYPPAESPTHRIMLNRFRRLSDELVWDQTESSRVFDCLRTRRSFAGSLFWLPLFQPAAVSPLSYLPPDTLTLTLDFPRLSSSLALHDQRIQVNFQEMVTAAKPALPPQELFLDPADFLTQLTSRPGGRLHPLAPTSADNRQSFAIRVNNHVLLKQELDLARPIQGLILPLAHRIKHWHEQGDQVFLACRSHRHATQMAEMLATHDINCQISANRAHPREAGQRLPTTTAKPTHPATCHLPGATPSATSSSASGTAPGATPDTAPSVTSKAAPDTATVAGDSAKKHRPTSSPTLSLEVGPLSGGFDLIEEKIHWLSETELFGERRLGPAQTRQRAPAGKKTNFNEINHGDLVVHRRHGIGIYQGLTPIELNGITNDYLSICYRGDDKLFIPVDQINHVGKYQGVSEQEPNLDKLGDKSWLATRNRVKKAVWQVAQDLLNLYARRQLAAGTSFTAPGEMFHELEESFPFDETPDQLKAIDEVLTDLCSERPMDRLVCGDVGYGKTEVAIRAAFKVVEDGAQVALLVPTTVLAEQHVATFRQRLTGFSLRVESLNRFRSPRVQKEIIAHLAAGQVDIIIGTHRLLSSDVKFKKLGLLIVDEEHRFGVGHKERLKKLRSGVDVLALTATPIPRTLQLSLLGVRDLSVISSPPSLRRTVKTFIARHDDLVIREAIHRELGRGGQVFLVHNQVRTIHEMAAKVQRLVPEAQVAVAHGQMPSRQLEEIMVRFVRREINVLVCTTIIESGLDIPSANTIIITQAERLGLAGIYQLRGRVGRSSEQAYAYLLVANLEEVTGEARRRFQALIDYNELGGGFKLALSDLQIRGGGNILGENQSGNIAAVGYDMYLELLQKTVLDLKRRDWQLRSRPASFDSANPEKLGDAALETLPVAEEEEIEPEIKLRIAAHLPANYINDVNQRYLAYRKITAAENDEALADMKDEFSDRFGPLPPEAVNLFEIIALKNRLATLGVSRLEQGPVALVFSFHSSTSVPPQRILSLVDFDRKGGKANKNKSGRRFTPQGRLISPLPSNPTAATVFHEIKKLLHALENNDIP